MPASAKAIEAAKAVAPIESGKPRRPLAIEVILHDERLRSEPELRPSYGSNGAAGLDLRACLVEPLLLEAGSTRLISSGLSLHIAEPGLCGVLAPRSGLGIKHGVILANAIGVIDSDYTGIIMVGAWNRSSEDYLIEPYIRICQLLFIPAVCPELRLVDELSADSVRGSGGLGSSGIY